ncbi:hypothetical protein C7M84_018503 [Penaeus vannamei]|uniref:Uncharacterized protein n=1 Tax=Penaeus vannamei TaxID=6689 RepID=A0A3R7PES3_PENVA|nr:hypothetical protein C7M84_018503 [Penaeus vannamei]
MTRRVVYKAVAEDEDLGLTCPLGPGLNTRCPCAAVHYVILESENKDNDIFEIHDSSGQMFLKKGALPRPGGQYQCQALADDAADCGGGLSAGGNSYWWTDLLRSGPSRARLHRQLFRENEPVSRDANESHDSLNVLQMDVQTLTTPADDGDTGSSELTLIEKNPPAGDMKPGMSIDYELVVVLPRLSECCAGGVAARFTSWPFECLWYPLSLCPSLPGTLIFSPGHDPPHPHDPHPTKEIDLPSGTRSRPLPPPLPAALTSRPCSHGHRPGDRAHDQGRGRRPIAPADVTIDKTLNQDFGTFYDHAVLNFGKVQNQDTYNPTPTDKEPSTIRVLFTAILIKNTAYTNDTVIVTAGAEYDSERYVWVSQATHSYIMIPPPRPYVEHRVHDGPDGDRAVGGRHLQRRLIITTPFDTPSPSRSTRPTTIHDKFSVTQVFLRTKGSDWACTLPEFDKTSYFESVTGRANHRAHFETSLLLMNLNYGQSGAGCS